MKRVTLENVLDQRRVSTHLIFLLFSLAFIVLIITVRADFQAWDKYLVSLIMIFLQLELFVFLGIKIFRGFNPVSTPKVVTRLILSRFLLFYLACFTGAFILMMAMQYFVSLLRFQDVSRVFSNFIQFEFWGWFKTTAAGLSVGALLFVFFLWQDALRREQKLREEKLIFQHETLKSQVNPHFLFNSLNTISSLIQTKPETADQFVKNLSSVYRYILENGQKDKVPLQSELDFITGYFDLHKIRDEEKILLAVEAPDAEKYKVLPVSLQILLENAIKHNIASRTNQLRINIYIEDQSIVVKNNLQLKASQLLSTGTGLKNLAERVRLISGRELIIEETNDYFVVKLPLLT
jgi:hypothetical protein